MRRRFGIHRGPLLLDAVRFAGHGFRGMPGQSQKHLVEARLTEREIGDPYAAASQLADRDGGTIGVGTHDGKGGGVGLQGDDS